jgi:hypothetical protein
MVNRITRRSLLIVLTIAVSLAFPALAQMTPVAPSAPGAWPEYNVYRNTQTCQGSVAKTTPAAGWIPIYGPCAFTGCFTWIAANCEGGPDPKVPHFCQRNLCPR